MPNIKNKPKDNNKKNKNFKNRPRIVLTNKQKDYFNRVIIIIYEDNEWKEIPNNKKFMKRNIIDTLIEKKAEKKFEHKGRNNKIIRDVVKIKGPVNKNNTNKLQWYGGEYKLDKENKIIKFRWFKTPEIKKNVKNVNKLAVKKKTVSRKKSVTRKKSTTRKKSVKKKNNNK